MIKFLLAVLLVTPCSAQWRAEFVKKEDTTAINENFRRASIYSNRKLDRFGSDSVYGQPIFINGVKFGDGTIQNTAIPSTSAFLMAPATFQILLASQVIPSSATGYYGIRVATATYLATAPGACSAGDFISALTADGTKTCGTPSGSGDVVKAATQTFTGANTFTGSVSVSSLTANNATVSTITANTQITLSAVSAPAGIASKGVLYFDTETNVFMVKENNDVAKPIVDPPGNWTCTVRSTQSACTQVNSGAIFALAVSCSGNEKIFGWGWTADDKLSTTNLCGQNGAGSTSVLSIIKNAVTNQGVSMRISHPAITGYTKVSVSANCCQ